MDIHNPLVVAAANYIEARRHWDDSLLSCYEELVNMVDGLISTGQFGQIDAAMGFADQYSKISAESRFLEHYVTAHMASMYGLTMLMVPTVLHCQSDEQRKKLAASSTIDLKYPIPKNLIPDQIDFCQDYEIDVLVMQALWHSQALVEFDLCENIDTIHNALREVLIRHPKTSFEKHQIRKRIELALGLRKTLRAKIKAPTKSNTIRTCLPIVFTNLDEELGYGDERYMELHAFATVQEFGSYEQVGEVWDERVRPCLEEVIRLSVPDAIVQCFPPESPYAIGKRMLSPDYGTAPHITKGSLLDQILGNPNLDLFGRN